MAHTPEKWEYVSEVTYWNDYPHTKAHRVKMGAETLTVGVHDVDRHEESELEAKARLIAAAPDLLEALEDLVELAERTMDWANNDGGEFDPDDELAPARAAIAKARRRDEHPEVRA